MTLTHINRKTHAVEISLTNLAGQQSLDLLANDDGQQMHLIVKNVSAVAVDFDNAATSPQIVVRFRKGIVADVADITLEDGANWTISSDKSDVDTDTISLQAKAGALPPSLQPGETWKILLQKVKAVSQYGAQNSGVSFQYSGLRAGGVPIAASKRQVISLVNQMPPELQAAGGLVAQNKELDDLIASMKQFSGGTKSIGAVFTDLAQKLEKLEKENQEQIQRRTALLTDNAPLKVYVRGSNNLMTDASRESGSSGIMSTVKIQAASDSDAVWFRKETTVSFVFSDEIDNFLATSGAFNDDGGKLVPRISFQLAEKQKVEFKLENLPMPKQAGPIQLIMRIENLAASKDGADFYKPFIAYLPILAVPYTYDEKYVGIGTTKPRSALDTGMGLISGAGHDYQLAQWTMSGGGLITWKDNHLSWDQRFIGIGMGYGTTFKEGHVSIFMPSQRTPPVNQIPKEQVWDGQARTIDADKGIELKLWEALYAEHDVGGKNTDVKLFIKEYYSSDKTFSVPGNWLLVAVHNGDDGTLKLGTGAVIQKNSSYTQGSMWPARSIILWSGSEDKIPYGWALCDGKNGTPDLQNRFVIGAGRGNGTYDVNQTGGSASVTLTLDQIPAHKHEVNVAENGNHKHIIEGENANNQENRHRHYADWGDRRVTQKVPNNQGQWGNTKNSVFYSTVDVHNYKSDDDRSAKSRSLVDTNYQGQHSHTVSETEKGKGQSHENMPPFYALCYIMKL